MTCLIMNTKMHRGTQMKIDSFCSFRDKRDILAAYEKLIKFLQVEKQRTQIKADETVRLKKLKLKPIGKPRW